MENGAVESRAVTKCVNGVGGCDGEWCCGIARRYQMCQWGDVEWCCGIARRYPLSIVTWKNVLRNRALQKLYVTEDARTC